MLSFFRLALFRICFFVFWNCFLVLVGWKIGVFLVLGFLSWKFLDFSSVAHFFPPFPPCGNTLLSSEASMFFSCSPFDFYLSGGALRRAWWAFWAWKTSKGCFFVSFAHWKKLSFFFICLPSGKRSVLCFFVLGVCDEKFWTQWTW